MILSNVVKVLKNQILYKYLKDVIKVYYDPRHKHNNKIRKNKVVEVQRSDLVGQYLGSTTEKNQGKDHGSAWQSPFCG